MTRAGQAAPDARLLQPAHVDDGRLEVARRRAYPAAVGEGPCPGSDPGRGQTSGGGQRTCRPFVPNCRSSHVGAGRVWGQTLDVADSELLVWTAWPRMTTPIGPPVFALSAQVANGTLAAPNEPGGFLMSVAVVRYQNFVGGKWVDAVEGATTEIINPASGEAIGEVSQGLAGRRRPRGRVRPNRVAEGRQAALVRPRRDVGLQRQHPLFRRRGTDPRGTRDRRVHDGRHIDDLPRADRRSPSARSSRTS